MEYLEKKNRYLTIEIKFVFNQHYLGSSRLNSNVLDVTTFTTFYVLYLTVALRPVLQTGLFRWYMCSCHYLLLYKEVADGTVWRETEIFQWDGCKKLIF